jgi:antitoxin HigA-1
MAIIHKPLHPGEIVKDALFEETDLTVTEAARHLKVDRSTLSRLLNGHAGISADMAYRLALFLKTSPEMWLNIQKDYDLWHAKERAKKLKIKPLDELRKAA